MMNEVQNDGTTAATEDAVKVRMSKADALSALAKLAEKKTTTLEEVIAIQIAVRNIAKRLFDRERSWKRRHERQPGTMNQELGTRN